MQSQAIFKQDLEWSSQLGRTTHNSSLFALYLAMLQPDITARPRVASDPIASLSEPILESNYPVTPLATTDIDYQYAATYRELMNTSEQNARLWEIMHPQPLALRNDPYHLPEEVKVNMCWQAQQSSSFEQSEPLTSDETQLYDLLETLA